MKRTSFQTETSKRSSTCKVCSSSISNEVIRIKTDSYGYFEYYHFSCYTPKLKQYISKNDLKINLDPENAKLLDNWLNDWNKNYVPLDKPFHEPPNFSKLVNSVPSKQRRTWLEIFKFLDAVSLLKIYSHVNKEFYHISWDEELWHFYCLRDYAKAPLDHESKSYRTQYITLRMESCFWCHALLKKENYNRCPLLEKPLCADCQQLSSFKQLSKSQIELWYKVNPTHSGIKIYSRLLQSKI